MTPPAQAYDPYAPSTSYQPGATDEYKAGAYGGVAVNTNGAPDYYGDGGMQAQVIN